MKRLLYPACAVVCLCALAWAAAACGDGSEPTPIVTSLTPGATTSVAGSPSPGVTDTLTPGPGKKSGAGGTDSDGTASDGSGGTTGDGSGAQITDTSIRANIIRRLSESPALTGVSFKVRVRALVVVISGIVKQDSQKKVAEEICLTEPGIKKVISAIQVEPVGSGGY